MRSVYAGGVVVVVVVFVAGGDEMLSSMSWASGARGGRCCKSLDTRAQSCAPKSPARIRPTRLEVAPRASLSRPKRPANCPLGGGCQIQARRPLRLSVPPSQRLARPPARCSALSPARSRTSSEATFRSAPLGLVAGQPASLYLAQIETGHTIGQRPGNNLAAFGDKRRPPVATTSRPLAPFWTLSRAGNRCSLAAEFGHNLSTI